MKRRCNGGPVTVPRVSILVDLTHAGFSEKADWLRLLDEQSETGVELVLGHGAHMDVRGLIASAGSSVTTVVLEEATPNEVFDMLAHAARGRYLWRPGPGCLVDASFLRKTADALDQSPQASFAFVGSRFVDFDGTPIAPLCYEYGERASGPLPAADFIRSCLRHQAWLAVNETACLLRKSALRAGRESWSPSSRSCQGDARYLDLLAHGPAYLLNEPLCRVLPNGPTGLPPCLDDPSPNLDWFPWARQAQDMGLIKTSALVPFLTQLTPYLWNLVHRFSHSFNHSVEVIERVHAILETLRHDNLSGAPTAHALSFFLSRQFNQCLYPRRLELLLDNTEGLLIYGVGSFTERFLSRAPALADRVTGFLQSQPGQSSFLGKPVFTPETLEPGRCPYILILSSFYPEIWLHLEHLGFHIFRHFLYLPVTLSETLDPTVVARVCSSHSHISFNTRFLERPTAPPPAPVPAPTMRESLKHEICLVCWGTTYTGFALRYFLPSLLAPGNLPSWPDRSSTTLVIYTTAADWSAIEASKTTALLRQWITLEWRPIEAPDQQQCKYTWVSKWHEQALLLASQHGATCFMTAPDITISDGAFEEVARLIEKGVELVLTMGYHINQAHFDEFLAKEVDPQVIAIDPDRCRKLMFRHMHALTLARLWHGPICYPRPCNIYSWAENGDLEARCAHLHPFFFKNPVAGWAHDSEFHTIDGDYLQTYAPLISSGKIAVVDDARLMILGISPELPIEQCGEFRGGFDRLGDLASFLDCACLDINRWFFQQVIRYSMPSTLSHKEPSP